VHTISVKESAHT